MTPSKTASRLRNIADRISASERPSASAVSGEIRRLVAAVTTEPVVVKDQGGTTWEIANPSDHDWTRTLWALQFGATGTTFVLAWANSMDDALEEAADFLSETGKKGYFVPDDIMQQHYAEAREELGPDAEDDQVSEKAETDLTYTEAGWIPSWEWTASEAPPELVELAKAASVAAGGDQAGGDQAGGDQAQDQA